MLIIICFEWFVQFGDYSLDFSKVRPFSPNQDQVREGMDHLCQHPRDAIQHAVTATVSIHMTHEVSAEDAIVLTHACAGVWCCVFQLPICDDGAVVAERKEARSGCELIYLVVGGDQCAFLHWLRVLWRPS